MLPLIFLTSERSEEVPFLRGVLWGVERTRVPAFAVFSTEVALFIGVGCWYLGKLGFGRSPTELLRRFLKSAIYRGTLFSGQNAKLDPVGARNHVGGWNLVQRHIFSMRGDWGGLFLDGAIYSGSLFSDRNTKMGPDRARNHVGHWNLVQRHIFLMRADWGGLFLDGTIYRDSLFSGWNVKMGPDRVRSHVGGWNLVQRHIFSMCEHWGGLFSDGTIHRGEKA